jgi:hypothetical protein
MDKVESARGRAGVIGQNRAAELVCRISEAENGAARDCDVVAVKQPWELTNDRPHDA